MFDKNGYYTCSCGTMFKYEDIVKKIRNYAGIDVTEKVCPYCGGLGFTHQSHEKWFYKYDKEYFKERN